MFRLLIILLLWSLNSCKGQSESKESFITDEPEVVNNIALDKLLKCDMYDIREGHYRIPDYGCVYAPINENILGNADIILIPITKFFDTDNVEKKCSGDIDCLKETYEQINSLTIDEIKSNFNSIIFLIENKFLKNTPKLDQSYNPTIPYEIIPYILKEGKWTSETPYKVKDDKTLRGESKWKDSYIDSLVQKFNKKDIVDLKKPSISKN